MGTSYIFSTNGSVSFKNPGCLKHTYNIHVYKKYRSFRHGRNIISEQSFGGVPALLYNITKSVPDPLK